MQSARVLEHLRPRAQVEVVGITKDDLSADLITKCGAVDSLDGTLRPDGHEDRCFDQPMGGMQFADAGVGVVVDVLERKTRQIRLSGD